MDYLLKNKKGQNFQFLPKKYGLTPLEKCFIFDFSNPCFLSLKWLDFDLQGQKIFRFRLSCHKTKQDKLSKFDQKLGTPHFQKMSQNTLFRTIMLKN